MAESFKQWLEVGKDLADELAAKAPPKKQKKKTAGGFKVTWRERDRDGKIIPQHKRKTQSVKSDHSRQLPDTEISQPAEIPPEVPNLEEHLQKLRNVLDSVSVPVSAEVEETSGMSAWAKRLWATEKKFRTAIPELLDCRFAAETLTQHCCELCKTVEAVIRCLDCIPSGTQFLCHTCDSMIHQKQVFHDREAMLDGFFRPIPHTSSVVMDEHGQYHLDKQVCVLPIPPPSQICSCDPNQNFPILPGKQTVLVTINGPYHLCLPTVCCPHCSSKWTPGKRDLLRCKYWPATSSFQMLFRFDVFTSFEQMKLASPALSQHAFKKMLEHRALSTGRMGSICGDTFHRVFREFAFCKYKKDDLCLAEPFKCPACVPDMLAVSADGNRKHYRFKKSKGTDEPSLFEGLFIAEDSKVSAFVNQIRSDTTTRAGHDVCGSATFTAGRETSSKSRAKVDEEGLEIAVCRHGILLQGLNHYRGEIYAYPLFLQKELAATANTKFFCMDIACRYWPYLRKVAEKFPELQPLTDMKPFLSVMHAKAHTGKCEVKWGGRNQEGAGTTIGEEVEQVNSFLSRAALTTKYMTKSGRTDMITVLAMGWNHRKVEILHKALTERFVKTTKRAEIESANLESLKQELNISAEETQQWVEDVKQWAVTERHDARSNQEELQREIDEIVYSLRRKKHDIYRQNDSNQTRLRKRRRLGHLKKKLKERIMHYNSICTSDQSIDPEAVCSLSDDVALPWDVQGNAANFRLKRQLFDQVMLVRRMEEEKIIIVKEMTQHYRYLREGLDKLDNLIHKTDEDIKNHTSPPEMTEEGYRGLHCCLLQKRHILLEKLSSLARIYGSCDVGSSFLLLEEEEEEEEETEEDDSSSAISEEDV